MLNMKGCGRMLNMAHVGVVVKDLNESILFYTKVLECEISGTSENERIKMVYLSAGSSTIELLKYKQDDSGRGKGIIDHLAFYVINMEEALKKVEEYGSKMLFDSPRDMGYQKIMFFLGPDGERIEFIETKQ
ncbi:MAG: methylmalonyl-CoA epimerase [Clostridiales bacterium]|jgi:lactoylglutathione lyase|nr:methylmalonyl-CoA epimerase [Clostridiales bacterium]